MHIAVLVCGDLGMAPRMCYHIQSLLEDPNNHISYVGQTESSPPQHILSNPDRITLVNIPHRW